MLLKSDVMPLPLCASLEHPVCMCAAPQVLSMLSKEPTARPSMPAVEGHPMWWEPDVTLRFLMDISDRWVALLCTIKGCLGVYKIKKRIMAEQPQRREGGPENLWGESYNCAMRRCLEARPIGKTFKCTVGMR